MKKIWKEKDTKWLIVANTVIMLLYACFSYGLMTPNLVLSSNSRYWQWQTAMSEIFYHNHLLTSIVFLLLLSAAWVVYFKLAKGIENKINSGKWTGKEISWVVLLSFFPLLISYNALSADVFNYIFNAKMVVLYHANPHTKVALDFPNDEIVRFLHNSHTAAPYGYAWTGISIPFYLLGMGKFILQWLMMRMAALISFTLTGWIIWRWWSERRHGNGLATENNSTHKSEKKTLSQIFTTPIWLLINPLLLIEVISNNHNDLWMIVPAMASFLLLDNKKKKNGRRVLFSALLLFFSTQIKFATLVLIPFWLYMAGGREFIEIIKMKCRCQVWLAKTHEWVENYFFDLIALAMFIPLFTNRSQMFHPWYLTWSLVWLPFCRWQWSRISLVAFSVSATLRYLPFLIVGNYSETVLTQQKIVTFAGAGIIILCFIIFYSWQKKSGSVIE